MVAKLAGMNQFDIYQQMQRYNEIYPECELDRFLLRQSQLW